MATTTKRKPYERDMTLNALPLSRFHWHKESNTLSAEDSDLRSSSFDGTHPWMQRVYTDACDIGICIYSELTERFVRFTLSKEEVRDGDLLWWEFKPLDDAGLVEKVIIWND